jgi:hypothetical protein
MIKKMKKYIVLFILVYFNINLDCSNLFFDSPGILPDHLQQKKYFFVSLPNKNNNKNNPNDDKNKLNFFSQYKKTTAIATCIAFFWLRIILKK